MPREAQAGENGAGPGGPAGGAASNQPTSPEAGSAAAASDTRPGGGLGNPIDTPDPLTKYRWWILGSLSLVLAAGAAFFLRTQSPNPAAAPVGASGFAAPAAVAGPGTFAPSGSPAVQPSAPEPGAHNGGTAPVAVRAPIAGSALLSALKDELFALETERLEGKLSESDYAQLKGAFETVLRRALNRQSV